MSRQQEVLEGGHSVVVDSFRVAHVVGGPCFDDEIHYIPLRDADEATAHGYRLCRACCGSVVASESALGDDSNETSPEGE